MKSIVLNVLFYAVFGLMAGAAFGPEAGLISSGGFAVIGLALSQLVIMPTGVLGNNITYVDKIKALGKERGELEKKMNGILELESPSGEQLAEFDQHEARINDLDKEIERFRKMEERNKAAAGGNGAGGSGRPGEAFSIISTPGDKEPQKRFSFVKFLREASDKNQQLSGFEKEMHEEAVKEARTAGTQVKNFGIPYMILGSDMERRDMTADGQTSAAGDQGGDFVPLIKTGFIDLLYAKMVLRVLGAQFLTGLTGDVDLPGMASGATASWKTETDDSGESNPTTKKVELRPKRLTTFVDVSKQLLIQTSQAIENMVKNDLAQAVQIALETAAINGSGSAPNPRGILNTSGIGAVAIGTDGGAPTWEHICKLEEEVAVDNADIGALAYLTNPKVRRKLKTTPISTGTTLGHIWTPNENNLNGYNAAVSTLCPSTLSKGSATGTLSAIIFGNFNDLVLAQWAGLDIMVNPYTKAKSGLVEVIVNSYHDIGIRNAVSFAAIKDAVTT